MSDFSIRNRIEPEKIQIQNQDSKVDNNQKTDHKSLNEAISLSQKLESELNHNENIISGTSPKDRLKTLMDKLKTSGTSAGIEQFDKKFFLLNINKSLVNSVFSNNNTNLQKMQMEASECDLKFKEKCIDALNEENDFTKMGMLYKTTTSNSQRAYLDLMSAFLMTAKFQIDSADKSNQSNHFVV